VGKLSHEVSTSYTAVGSTTHLAVQLAQHAEPGTILISNTTARRVRGEARLETLGAIQLTEQTPPLLAFRVLGVGLPLTSMAILGRMCGASLWGAGENWQCCMTHWYK
jgi:class 3 adenylate cyclase